MNPTTVVHCKRADYDVYIGRPSKWGKPFTIGRGELRDTTRHPRSQCLAFGLAISPSAGMYFGARPSPRENNMRTKICPNEDLPDSPV